MNYERFVNSGYYRFFSILTDLVILNLLWFLTTICTFGILLLPASFALFAKVKDVINGDDGSLFKGFFQVLKKEFKLGIFLLPFFLIISYLLYLYYSVIFLYFKKSANLVMTTVSTVLVSLFVGVIILTLLQIFLWKAHYPTKEIKKTLIAGFVIVTRCTKESILAFIVLLVFIALGYFFWYGYLFLFMSLFALSIYSIYRKKYQLIENE